MSNPMEIMLQRLQQAAQAFCPSAPITNADLFSGRSQQMWDIFNAVNQRGQHIILFGERGVGKTSLAKVTQAILRHQGVIGLNAETVNCDPSTNFSQLWSNIFKEITFTIETPGIGFNAETTRHIINLASNLPENITPEDVRQILQQIPRHIVIILDEVDQIADPKTTTLLANTIKTLSDHSVNATLVLVGVADSVDTLIAEHQSIERAVSQIRMPRMSIPELYEIMDKGFSTLQIEVDHEVKHRIAKVSQGLPHYTHKMSLNLAQAAIQNGSNYIGKQDLLPAIETSLRQAQQSIKAAYDKATYSPRENLYCEVLLACALAEPDDMGFFSAVDIKAPMSRIMGRPYDISAFSQHLNKFSKEERGPVLQQLGSPRSYRFRFVNPLMQPHVIMNGLKAGMITEMDIDAI